LSYFQEAKAYFIASHQNPINIFLHHLTVLLAISAVVLLYYDWRWTLGCLVLTQVFAIGGHAWFEKNQPAFVKYRLRIYLACVNFGAIFRPKIAEIWKKTLKSMLFLYGRVSIGDLLLRLSTFY
jgi:hypothetical protein